MDLSFLRSRAYLIYKILFLTLASIVLISCEQSQKQSNQSAERTHQQVDRTAIALGADSSGISDHDYEVLVKMNVLVSRWNITAAPLVRDYLDPNVSGDTWVRDATSLINEMRSIHMEMSVIVISMQDEGLRSTLNEVVENYRDKLDALVMLQNAVSRGDAELEQEAQTQLSEAGEEGKRLALSYIEKIRPFVDPTELEAQGRKKAKEISDRMQQK